MRIDWETARDLALRVFSILGDLLSRINLMWFVWWLAVGLTVAVVILLVYFLNKKHKLQQRTPKPAPKTTLPTSKEPAATKDWKAKRRQLLYGSIAVYAALTITGFLAPRWLTLNWGLIALFGSIAHFYLSFDQVNPDEHAIVLLFGKILFQAEEGWAFVPAGLFKIAKVTRGLIRGEFGTPFTRRVDKEGNVVEVPDEGDTTFVFRQPFRPNFQGMKTLYEKNKRGPVDQSEFPDNLHFQPITEEEWKELGGEAEHKPQTPDLRYIFTFKVVDMIHFFMNVEGDTVDEKLLNVAQLISDQSKAAISEIAGMTTFGFFLTEQAKASARIRHRVEILLGEEKSFSDDLIVRERQIKNYPYLGVDLNNTRMKDPGFPLRVNEAMANAAAAGHEKQTTIAASEGEKARLTNVGEGEAAALKARLLAEAEGLLKLAEAAKAGDGQGMEILRLRSFVEGMQRANTTILPGDFSVLGSLIAAAKPILQQKS